MTAYPKPKPRPKRRAGIDPAAKPIVYGRDDYRCVIEGPDCTGEAQVLDHRANRGMGGSQLLDDLAVLITACSVCNNWKEDQSGAVLEALTNRGIRVRRASTSAATVEMCRRICVRYPDGRRYKLGSDGSRNECTDDHS